MMKLQFSHRRSVRLPWRAACSPRLTAALQYSLIPGDSADFLANAKKKDDEKHVSQCSRRECDSSSSTSSRYCMISFPWNPRRCKYCEKRITTPQRSPSPFVQVDRAVPGLNFSTIICIRLQCTPFHASCSPSPCIRLSPRCTLCGTL